MRNSVFFRASVLILLLALTLAACRREEEARVDTEATSAPVDTTATTPTEQPATAEPPATAEAEPTATVAAPQPIAPEDIDWAPQVVASDPPPGSEIPLESPIALRFDQPMDQTSVEEAWTIEPAVTGSFQWPRPDTVVFQPGEQLQRGQSYLVRVSDAAEAANGQALTQGVELNLQTVGNLEVNQVIPADGTESVQTDGAVTVVFSRPVVPLVSSDQQAGLPQPLVLEPATEGQGTWISTSIYRFVPGPEGLAGATTYNASIEEGLTDITGAVLAEGVSWQFTTQSPDVVSVLPPNGATLVPPTRAISITFNMPMDPASTQAAVSLEPAAAVGYDWQDEGRLLVLTPEEGLDLSTAYELTVAQSALSANGAASLEETSTTQFTTLPFPGVKETFPPDGAAADAWQRGVNITFESPMDMETLEGRILIEPEPDDEVRYNYNQWIDEVNPSNSNFSLYLDFDLERNTEYTITIPADAADQYGNTFGEPYSWSFTMPGFSPVASFNLPSPLSQISTSFPSDVQIVHRNVSQLEVGLYDPDIPLWDLEAFAPWRDEVTLPAPLRTWTLSVDTPQDEVGVTTVSLADGGTLDPGVYVITVTAPEVDPDFRYWQNQRHALIVADNNLVVKEMPGEVRVWVTDLETGEPASGHALVMFNADGDDLGTATSDNNGFALFEYTPPDEFLPGLIVVSEEEGAPGFGIASNYWTGELNIWRLGLNQGYGPVAELFSYLYTDRPIYRPGDTVYFKGIVREPQFGRYALPEEQTLTLHVAPAFFTPETEGLEDSISVEVNAEGIFSGEYQLSEDMPLGSYNFFSQDQNLELFRTFTVAEYRRPEFQVTLTPQQEEALRGESVDVVLEAQYFFGGTASGLQVNWELYQDVFSPDVPGPVYAFGDQADFFYEPNSIFGPGGGGTFGQWLTSGTGTTDENGRLVITIPADALDEVDEGSRRVTVQATVTDITNLPITANADVIFHAAELYAGVRPQEFISTAGTETSAEVLTVDWAGEAVGNQEVEVAFYYREWVPSRNSDFGMYFTQWEAIDTEVDRVTVTTDGQGEAEASFVPAEGGTYLAVTTVTDGGGRTQTSSTTLWVMDENFAGWRADPRAKSMDLVADKRDYQVGETARILVQSPFTEPVNAWLTIERGALLEQRVITIEAGSAVLDLPVTAEFAPNVYVSIFAIKPATPQNAENPYADIRMGITELRVAPDQFDLNVELTPLEDLFRPGDTAVYDVLITDNQGNPVSADFSLALVDLAVLTLQEDNAPPILEAFYSPQPYRSQVGSGLFISGEGLEPEIPLEGGGLGGGGGDGMAAEAVARLEEEDETRRNFPDTAYWEASVQTDSDGRATVEIPLPDTLTTWRLSSKAVTTDTKVGQGSADVVATLPLLIRPVTPRFFTVADVVQLGAVVNNNTDAAIEATVSLEAEGLTLAGDAEQVVTVPANGSQLVRWEVTVEDVPFADLTFRVEGGGEQDATKPPLGVGPDNLIPVYRYDAQDFAGTAGELDEAGERVEAVLLPPNADTRRGSLDMQLSPSLAAALVDALTVLERTEYNPACGHEVANRLLPNLATAGAIADLDLDMEDLEQQLAELIPADIAQLESLQQRGGGWSWCYATEADPWLSAYSLLTLAKAEDAGYDVSSTVIDRGRSYLRGRLVDLDDINFAWEANREAFFLYVLAEAGDDVSEQADALVEDHQNLLDSYAKALLVLAYELTGDVGSNQQTLLADLNDEAIISATGAHWEDAENDFFNLNSNIRGTAIVIEALATVEPDSALLPPAVRWLMVARTASVWSTTHETAWSIYALTNWMATSGELEADYTYAVELNAVPLTEGAFTSETIADSESLSVPVGNLLAQDTNFVSFQRGAGDGRLYYTLHLNSFVSAESVAATSRGLTVQRVYYDAACDPEEETCEPIEQIEAGQQVRVQLTVIAPTDLVYAVVEDPLPAGAEGIDPGLATSAAGFEGGIERVEEEEPYRFGYWGWWIFDRIEYRDEKVVFTANQLPAGTYQYTYYLQTVIPGEYQVMPAVGYQEFSPEVFGRSDGMLFTITGE